MSANLQPTGKFTVHDLSGVKQHKAAGPPVVRHAPSRATKESGARIEEAKHIAGTFEPSKESTEAFQAERLAVFDKLWNEYQDSVKPQQEKPISVTLPDGTVKHGFMLKTTPIDIAKEISQGLADAVCIAKVIYTSKQHDDGVVACDEDDEAQAAKAPTEQGDGKGELWDLNRPLTGDCKLQLLKFDDPEAKTVFWHSSAHILGNN